MCLSDLVRVAHLSPDGRTAFGHDGDREVAVSLAVLVLDGVAVTPGDWLVVHTGLAVERLDDDGAAAVLATRAEVHGTAPVAPGEEGA